MKVSVNTAVRAAAGGVLLGRTWRFRDVADPAGPVRWPSGQVILACWHEYLLGFALLGRGKGFTSLASHHDDGEIITRVVTSLGFEMARGSSSRGGSGGYRELLRGAAAGRSIYLTTDGPRGPRHRCQPGVARLASRTGLPIIPMAMTPTAGIRLDSWDRFVVPAPASRIFVAFGDPIFTDPSTDDPTDLLDTIEIETRRQVARSEVVAAEARRGRPYSVCTATGAGSTPPPSPTTRRIEARLRKAWSSESPPLDLRLAAATFRLARRARHGSYDVGVIESRRAPVPVISVGGLTIGGSGKTPLASRIAGWLLDRAHRPAILTRGYVDELRLHAALRPDAIVMGHADRHAIACRAAADGATVAILDDGFQHRRLARDLDVVAIDRDALRRTNRMALPAGPFRESIREACGRADALVLLGREPLTGQITEFEDEWLDRLDPQVPVARASIETLQPEVVGPGQGRAPTVALTGVMKPNLFFDFVRENSPTVKREHALPDHGLPGPEWPDLLLDARAGGFVLTLKDYMRLGSLLPDDTSVWVARERLRWHGGEDELRQLVHRAAGPAPEC